MLNLSKFQKDQKYLLACSGGVDSIALYHLLKDNNIEFDVVTINYNFREQSIDEVNNVAQLCLDDNRKFFLFENTERISSNMEKVARDIRYSFFDDLMNNNSYAALLTGHNLNDKVEWFLMQFTKGAGVKELTGMNLEGSRKGYITLKPLIDTERSDIEDYISKMGLMSFYDVSNSDLTYHPVDNPSGIKRNYFRHHFAAKLTKEFKTGIKKTFDILEQEASDLASYEIHNPYDKVVVIDLFNDKDTNALQAIDVALKTYFNHLLTGPQRKEILKQKDTGIVLGDFTIGFSKSKVLITPFIGANKVIFDQSEKDSFRKQKIPPKSRAYLKINHTPLLLDF